MRINQLLCLCVSAIALTACGSSGSPDTANGVSANATYNVQVTWTKFGIPHIKADNWKSIGYGMGYAYAEDNMCVLMEDIVAIRGERARHFGRDGSFTIRSNGRTASNVDSDFFWRHVLNPTIAAELRSKQPQEMDDTIVGYAAGFSRYVRELKAGQHPGRHQACSNTEWLREITTEDMYYRIYRLAIVASSSVFMTEVANAQPPLSVPFSNPKSSHKAAALTPAQQAQVNDAFAFFTDPEKRFGSNMYGFGKDATESSKPLLWGNPHFPWLGPERLWAMHLQKMPTAADPSTADIMGVSLHGAPAVLIGFNNAVAWSHTVSAAYRFSFFELSLGADPTTYTVDGQLKTMQATDITIDVLEADGSITQESRTLYKSEYGPMVDIVDGVLEWGTPPGKAYTLRDANAENDRIVQQFFRWNQANNLDEFKALHASVLGTPWVNTVAIGKAANGGYAPAYYGDVTVVPNVPNSKLNTCAAQPAHSVVQTAVLGLPVLNGSLATCNWDTDADAPAPGIFGGANLPTLDRNDYVHNCNDSYWLTNWREPVTGFADIIGNEGSARSLRTRLCITQAEQRLDGSDGLGGDNVMTVEKLQNIGLGSRVYTADFELDGVLTGICNSNTLTIQNGDNAGAVVDISDACDVLSNWDRRNNLDSIGGHIWREFWQQIGGTNNAPWTVAFNNTADETYKTPRTLDTADADLRDNFSRAVKRIQDNNVPLTAPTRDLQWDLAADGNTRIPIFGGSGTPGSFTIWRGSNGTPTQAEGYGKTTFGNSYVTTVTFDDNDNVQAEAFLTYSQSTDPASPHFDDWTRAYSQKAWHKMPYTTAEIAADTLRTKQLQE